MKGSTLEIRRSKIEVTQDRTFIWMLGRDIVLDPCDLYASQRNKKKQAKDAHTLHYFAVRPDQPRCRVETKFDVRGGTLDVVPVLGF